MKMKKQHFENIEILNKNFHMWVNSKLSTKVENQRRTSDFNIHHRTEKEMQLTDFRPVSINEETV